MSHELQMFGFPRVGYVALCVITPPFFSGSAPFFSGSGPFFSGSAPFRGLLQREGDLRPGFSPAWRKAPGRKEIA